MRAKVDFFEVEDNQRAMDKRLENWAVWCNGRGGSNVSPMFRLYRSTDVHGDCNAGGPDVDAIDGMRLAKAVGQLPEKHRFALNWYYITRGGPKRACQQIGVNVEGLAQYVRDGRRMLMNRNV